MPIALDDDVVLVARMANGDDEALGLLYDRMHTHVYAIAAALLPQPAEVEEVVEEVFWHAWRQSWSYVPKPGGVTTWLATITRSRVLRQSARHRDGGFEAAHSALAALRESPPIGATASGLR